jgi:hypothetical protein
VPVLNSVNRTTARCSRSAFHRSTLMTVFDLHQLEALPLKAVGMPDQ